MEKHVIKVVVGVLAISVIAMSMGTPTSNRIPEGVETYVRDGHICYDKTVCCKAGECITFPNCYPQ